MLTFSSNVKPAIWWYIVSQCYAWCVYTVKLWKYIPSFGLWMPSNLHQNNRERWAWRKCTDRELDRLGAICCSRSINVTNDLSLRASSSIGQGEHAKHYPSYITQQKAVLEKEGLTFAFALACAAAHAGPKSGSSEESTYEIWLERVSPSKCQNDDLCNSQKVADWGWQWGKLGVLGYQTVPGREKKRLGLLG